MDELTEMFYDGDEFDKHVLARDRRYSCLKSILTLILSFIFSFMVNFCLTKVQNCAKIKIQNLSDRIVKIIKIDFT